MNRRPLDVFLAWWGCVKRGAHLFDERNVCTDCGAELGGKSLSDLIREERAK